MMRVLIPWLCLVALAGASKSPTGTSGPIGHYYPPLVSSSVATAAAAPPGSIAPLRRRMLLADGSQGAGEGGEPLWPAGPAPASMRQEEEALLLRQKQTIQYHDQWPSVAGKCHKRTLNFCASVLPFNTTTFPNIIGDTNRFEVKRSLPFFGFLAKSGCNKRLDELLCLLLEPPCGQQSGSAIPPCKKFCRLALEGCYEYIPATLAMSSVFDCRQYPDSSDPSVCVNLAQGPSCQLDEFQCPDKTCIPRNWLCDGVRDCVFAADEANCTATGNGLVSSVCSTEEFKCDGKCVPKAWRCDGERDCLDGSDEESCDRRPRCGPDRFKCADGTGCLPKRWVCDGKAECRDGSDELNCEQRDCSDSDFKCDNGICIPKIWRCDRQSDCKDGSDERNCIYPPAINESIALQTRQPEVAPPASEEPARQAQEAQEASGRQQLELSLGDDVTRIIKAQEAAAATSSSTQATPTAPTSTRAPPVSEPERPAPSTGASSAPPPSPPPPANKFDYDIIQTPANEMIPLGELTVSGEMQQAARQPAERVPIYRSLFKSLKGVGHGRPSGPPAAHQAGQRSYMVARRRRGEPRPSVSPARVPGPNPPSAGAAIQPADQTQAPANRPAGQQGVASYLQLLNPRYQLRSAAVGRQSAPAISQRAASS